MKPASPALLLKPGREKSLLRRHPWIFSGAVERLHGGAGSGDIVEIRASDGRFLAWAGYSAHSQIRARVFSYRESERPGEEWLRSKLRAAIGRRKDLDRTTNALRLVHGESDGLPGLIVDRYADTLVVQILFAGMEPWRDALPVALRELTGCVRIYERSDTDARELEGLPGRAGTLWGGAVPGVIEIVENGIRYQVDIERGQKTGFYLDQRDNRLAIGRLARDRQVLNCFCYTGAFSLSALLGGSRSVLSVDSSAAALELARCNAALNGLQGERAQWLETDVFDCLRALRRENRQFDLIVSDPPKFAPTASQAARAARGYKDINLNALRLLKPGGLLATFSCSGGVTTELFRKIVAGAAADAGVSATVVARYGAAADHPVLLEFPEGEYLKGLLLRREE